MPKALKRIKMMLVFPCMCSVAFYMGAQIVTHTEAAFVTEQKVQGSISCGSCVSENHIHVETNCKAARESNFTSI